MTFFQYRSDICVVTFFAEIPPVYVTLFTLLSTCWRFRAEKHTLNAICHAASSLRVNHYLRSSCLHAARRQ
jgi:hypothetical protein